MTGLADNYSVSGSGGAVINHGLYTDTVWAVPVTFKDTAGQAINLAGQPYVAEIVSGSTVIFRFRSSGAAANEGTLGLANAATGVIMFNASIAQHAVVAAGLYRVHLKRDLAEDVWTSEGTILIGKPGAKETYLLFDAPGVESAGALSYAQQAAAAAATAVGAAAAASTDADDAAASATAAASSESAVAASAAAAASSQSAAAASQSAAAGSATAAASSASAAASSEAAADVSEAAASTSATAAAGSATASQNARLASEAARDASVTAKTASESARDAAVVAKTAAETAETNAETAEVAAEAAQAAAEAARNAAQTSATQASTSKDAAAASATAAASSASAASADRVAAQTARSGAEAARDAASASAQTATTKAGEALSSANNAAASAAASEASKNAAATSASNIETSYGALGNILDKSAEATAAATVAVSSAQSANLSQLSAAQSALVAAQYSVASGLDTATRNAQAAASLAQGFAASAASVVQQDLSGITAQALHRSPNAITAMAIYDTSKDSDGGAWTEKCQHTSWWNEALSGKWLGAHDNEAQARVLGGATLGAELITNGSVSLDTTGWSASNATLQSVDGKLRVTGTSSGYPSAWQSFTTVVGRAYRVSFTQRTRSAGIFAVNKTDTTSAVGVNRVQFQNNNANNIQIVSYFIATATTSYIHFGLDGLSPFTGHWGEFDDISVREVQASNAVSGDYYQLATDGKFYRLRKNVIGHSERFDQSSNYWGTNGGGLPGTTVTANAALSPTGTLTADLIDYTAALAASKNVEVDFDNNPGGKTYTGSVYIKGIAGQTINLVLDGNGVAGTGVQHTLDGTWQRLSVTRTYPAGAVGGAIFRFGPRALNVPAGTATQIYAWGAQVELGSSPTEYEPKPGSAVEEVFRGNKADFPRLAAIVGEATSLTIYDLTEPGRPMWMRFNGHNGQNYAGHPLLNTNQTSIAAVNGNMIVGGNGGWTSWLIVANFIKETSRWYGSSNTGSTHGIWRSNFAQRNTLGQYDLFNGGSENLANNMVNAVAATVLPNAPVDPVTGLRNPTIAVATESALSIITAQNTVIQNASTSGWPVNGVCIIGTNVYWEWRGNYSSDVGVASLVGAFPAFTLSRENSILARNKYNQSSAGGLRAAGTYALKYDIQANAFYNNRTLSLYRHKSGPLSSMGASIHPTYNSGWMLSDANGTRRAYLASCIAGSIGPSVELFPNADFSSTDVSDWNKSNAAISVAINNGGLDFTFTANQQYLSKYVPVTPGKVYRVYLQANNFSLAPVVAQADTSGGNVDTNFTGGYWSNGSGSNAVYYGIEVLPTKPFLVVGYASAGPSTFRITSISVREVDFDRSPRSTAGPFVCAINGTLTKSQVATGTSLVGYSGFSAANYLREAYSPELEFGTGEWSCSAWVNVPATIPDASYSQSEGVETASSQVATIYGTGTVTNSGGVATATASSTSVSGLIYPNNSSMARGRYKVTFEIVDASGVNGSLFVHAGDANIGLGVVATPGVKTLFIDNTVNNFNLVIRFNPTGSGSYIKVQNASFVLLGPARIADRSFSSGPRLILGVAGAGVLVATAFDGTTTRTITTTAAYNTATWLKAEACYTTDGTLSIRVNGREVATTRGNPLLSLNSRYNLLLNSEQFDSWGKNQATVSSNAINAPDGTPTADLILDNTANAEHYVSQSFNCTNGIAYNFTGYLKKKTGSYSTCSVRTYLPGVVIHIIDFDAGTITNGGTLTIVGDGWYKFDITRTASATGTGYLETYTKQSGANVGTGSDGHYAWGFQVAAANAWNNGYIYQRVGSVNDVAFGAPLTIGNSFALDAPFPGSIALLKLSASVPTYEQSQFMYDQEKQLFRSGAQCVVPDSNPVIDMAYDDATDRWVAVSATNESYWTGLVRNSVTPVPAGSYTRIVAGSGLELLARSTTNPGVDVTIPAYGLREELVERAEAAARLSKELAIYDYVGGFTANTTSGNTAITNVSTITYPASYIGARISGSGIPANTTIVAVSGTTIYLSAAATATATGVSISFLDLDLPVGMEAKTVMSAGAVKQEGATKDYTRLYDGFIETIRFAVAPGATAWVQIQAQRITLQ